ncbi:hypothetical protein ULMA_22020 [Patiriisocius marinus]|uniref:Uncharacterized protein n=1 Tax=Patiriisocius marinus TaxID=1397112 RepID=A0A5J4IYK0_9FLAO|nr:hypothetical protein [Patiriisocius marinus]GER60094.1 hypothetical protein ULMA_22020 [Patiriisocius marinus]|tara:strand:+ start:285 stop:1583 length:1299 start_codon:yes stop_codon:yes gene_type:complete
MLHKRIINRQVNKHFTYKDIERCIKEAALMESGVVPHTDAIVDGLLKYYLEHPREERFKYALTDFALKFVKLLDNKLYSPYAKFPLRDTFKKLADFKSAEIKSIDDFNRWYEFNFEGNSGTVIIDHLEALKDYVNKAIDELNVYINQDQDSALKTAENVSILFEKITAKSEEIKDTLLISNSLDEEIEKVVNYFLRKKNSLPDNKTPKQKEAHKILREEYDRAVEIKKKVDDFFVEVEYKLGQLLDRSAYASTQLITVQDNFKNKSAVRINIKRLLKFTLEQAKFSKKEGFLLPEQFPIKSVVTERFKHIGLVYYEEFGLQKSYVIEPKTNEAHLKSQVLKLDTELTRQENTAKWVNLFKKQLQKEREIDFSNHFYDIALKENDTLIALKVGFELVEFARHNKEYEIKIDREIPESSLSQNIALWKMKIIKR